MRLKVACGDQRQLGVHSNHELSRAGCNGAPCSTTVRVATALVDRLPSVKLPPSYVCIQLVARAPTLAGPSAEWQRHTRRAERRHNHREEHLDFQAHPPSPVCSACLPVVARERHHLRRMPAPSTPSAPPLASQRAEALEQFGRVAGPLDRARCAARALDDT
jgi:hypothetical protein